jgi:nitrite reductase/ring-hydroxylating ferredoxin subunit
MADREKKYAWHKVADSRAELFSGNNTHIEINAAGKKICLLVHKENLFACAAKCPHAGGTMADGHVDALGNIVCPLHRYKFSLQNGRNVSGEGYFLKTYPVEIREEGVFIGIEEKNTLFGW